MSIDHQILEQVIAATADPLIIVRIDKSEWPVALCNHAFQSIRGDDCLDQPFADVIEQLVGRETALEISESVRSQQETSFAVELGGKEYLLALKPLKLPGDDGARYYVAFWRRSGGSSV